MRIRRGYFRAWGCQSMMSCRALAKIASPIGLTEG
jgi:hypothetical protein